MNEAEEAAPFNVMSHGSPHAVGCHSAAELGAVDIWVRNASTIRSVACTDSKAVT